MGPKPYLARVKRSSITKKQLQTNSTDKSCPIGTVPIRRTTKEDLLKARTLKMPAASTGIRQPSHLVFVSMERHVGEKFRGVRGIFSLYDLLGGVNNDEATTANVWVQGGPIEHMNYITAGSMISPDFYGDDRPRLFIYWSVRFVQVHHEITPGRVLSPVSKYDGPTYDFKVIMNQDKDTKNWVFTAFQEEIVVGYLPSELLPFLKDGAEGIAWGGVARSGNNGVTPPMGSGFQPVGPYRRYDRAAYFKFINYYDENYIKQVPSFSDSQERVDSSNCFALLSSNTESRRASFLFGGPGGRCGNIPP
ncbi:hypothetical protein EZV62_018914 [Acer yangbiense]|uniref:Neprosin PEP catalytic domain-containing protein n=1 Tax=Acer yangbiense TaxID=1000413 RepID=A0A5C7H9J8_9ROSI|nr:hypothetical protein EZV62_018914 [Acer yangbiense]